MKENHPPRLKIKIKIYTHRIEIKILCKMSFVNSICSKVTFFPPSIPTGNKQKLN